MKIKTLSVLALAILTTIITACDDNLNSIGNTIQPEGDDISIGVDTVEITAETVSFKDSIYAHTVSGWLGEYIDPVFGKVKSDYMCEFYCMEGVSFGDNILSVDSVIMNVDFTGFIGDSISPMGVSVYEVTSPLKPFFFTSADPANYTDNMSKLLGQSIFTIQELKDVVYYENIRSKRISTRMDASFGDRIFNELQTNKQTFSNSDEFKKFFKGAYITTTFGAGSLINVDFTELYIHYTYRGRNKENTADSIRSTYFPLTITPEVLQMNHIENSFPENPDLFANNDKMTYLKTPAGLYTRLTIPLNDIVKKVGKNQVLNGVNFRLKGYTDEEEKSGLARPNNLLAINEDDLPNFFFNREYDNMDTDKTYFLISRTTSTGTYYNSYDFKNMANIINYYADYYKDEAVLPDLHYLLIPVSVSYQSSSSSSLVVSDIYNQMAPTSAIFRTDPKNMKMSLIFSRYNK